MTLPNLAGRSFRYYFRANAGAIAGAAIASEIAPGAVPLLLHSCRGSKNELFMSRDREGAEIV
jgi:hypothetical protein